MNENRKAYYNFSKVTLVHFRSKHLLETRRRDKFFGEEIDIFDKIRLNCLDKFDFSVLVGRWIRNATFFKSFL